MFNCEELITGNNHASSYYRYSYVVVLKYLITTYCNKDLHKEKNYLPFPC